MYFTEVVITVNTHGDDLVPQNQLRNISVLFWGWKEDVKRSVCWTRNTTHRLICFCSATIRIFTPREQAKNPKAKRKLKKDSIWGTWLKIYSVFIGEGFSCWEPWSYISKLWTWVVCFVNRAALIKESLSVHCFSSSPIFEPSSCSNPVWCRGIVLKRMAKMTVATSHLLSETKRKTHTEWMRSESSFG